jgi:hypothetical protein
MTLPIIERRKIEAELLKNIYDVLKESHGKDVAIETIDTAVSKAAVDFGDEHRKKLGRDPNLQDMADILPNWTANDALKIDLLTQEPDKLDFNVTHCEYAKMYHKMGLGEIGHVLSCNRDGKFCTGYNPKMKFERTQTIMQGADHCDFRYTMENTEDEASCKP